MKQRKGKKMRN